MSKVPPNLPEAESAVIGGALINNDAFLALPSEVFYKSANKTIYEAMAELDAQNEPMDTVTLVNLLRSKGLLESVGGLPYIHTLTNEVPSVDHVEYYAKRLIHVMQLRKVGQAAHAAMQKAYNASNMPLEIIAEFEAALGPDIAGATLEGMKPALRESLNALERRVSGTDKFIDTGFYSIDHYCPMAPSDFVVFAGRSGMGKTSFMLDIAYNVAKNGGGVLIVSTEMKKRQITDRMMAQVGKVNAMRMRKGTLIDEDWSKLSKAQGLIADLNIEIVDTSSISIAEIRAHAKRMKQKKGLDFMVLDYLQKIALASREKDIRTKVMSTAAGTKDLAKDLDIVTFALAQVKREIDGQKDPRPSKADIMESAAIENEADTIGLLFRAEHYLKDKCPADLVGAAEIDWAKSRHGPPAFSKLTWLAECTTFAERDNWYGN